MKASDITIDVEFEGRLPPLTAEERSVLLANIVAAKAIEQPVRVWKTKDAVLMLDGHNRIAIYDELIEAGQKIKFPEPIVIDLESRKQALQWIDDNARGQRNLMEQWKSILRGRRYNAEKLTVEEVSAAGNKAKHSPGVHDEHRENEKTSAAIAKQDGVSAMTVRRDADKAKVYDVVEQKYGKDSQEARLVMTAGPKVIQTVVKSKASITPDAAVATITREKKKQEKERKKRNPIATKHKSELFDTTDTSFQKNLDKLKALGRVPKEQFWAAIGEYTAQRWFRSIVDEVHYIHIQEDPDGTSAIFVDESERDLCTAVHAQLQRMHDACQKGNKFKFDIAMYKKLANDLYQLVKKASMHKYPAEM